MGFNIIDKLVENLFKSLVEESNNVDSAKYAVEVLSEDEFNDILHRSKYVVICFYKPDCPACKRYVPIFEAVARRFRELATFVRVHTGNLRNVSRRFKISVIPTTVVLLDGSEVARYEGSMNETKLTMFLIAAGISQSKRRNA